MNNETIEISSLSSEIQKILTEYGEDVQRVADEEVVEISKEAVKKLKQTSPKRDKNSSGYSKGWKMKKKDTRFGVETTVYNSTHGWLVHILENGYEHREGGHVDGKPHVKPVQDWIDKELIQRIKAKL